MFSVAPDAWISPLADIERSLLGSEVTIGARTKIDSFVKVKPVGGMGALRIGSGTYINSGTVIYTGNGVVIGDNVLIGPNCTIVPTAHEYRDRDRRINEQRFRPSRGGIIIEDDVLINAGCILLDGAVLRQGCVVGAGGLVRGELDSYCVYVGTEVRKIGERGAMGRA